MKPDNEKGGKKSMYKKSKRFLAGFLAFLLVVTMVPTDMLSVVYAEEAEEIETQVLEDTDDDAVLENAEEAEVLEITEPEENTEEALEVNDNLKEGGSEAPSEPVQKPEPSQPSITPEPSQPSITPEPSEPASEPATDPQPTDPVEEVNDWELNMKDLASGTTAGVMKKKVGNETIDTIFSITAGFTLDTNGNYENGAYTARLKTGGKSSHTNRCIEFTPTKSGKLIVYAVPSDGKATDRALRLDVGDATNGEAITAPISASKMEFTVTAAAVGKVHHLGSTNSGINIYYIAMEYDPEPVDLSEATISVKVKDKDNKEVASPKYTGEAYKIETTVTDKDGKQVKNDRYAVSYERKGTGDSWDATTDLTGAGTIRVKVDKLDSGFTTNSKTSDEIVIAKANLEAENKTINHSPEETGSKEYAIAALFAETAGANTLSYALDTTVDGYNVGNVIENPTVADGKLTYSIVSTKPASITPAVLGIKVSSDNYNDKTFKITINVKEKTSVTIKLESKTHTYNGQKYGFKDNVVITEVTGTGITTENQQEAIDDLMENLSYKFQAEGGQAVSEEPTDAGTYTVTAELAAASAYTLSSDATGATLTISAKPIKIQAKSVEWDKSLKPMPVSGKAKADDYEFVAVSEGEENIGLVSGDSLAEQPTIKYYKKDTTDEMTEADWKGLGSTDTVDIVLSDADAGKNYEITACEKGTLTVKVHTADTRMTEVPEAGATLTAASLTNGTSYTENTLVGDNYFLITTEGGATVAVDQYGSPKANRIKTGGEGNPFSKSIGFKVSKAAKITVSCMSGNDASERKVWIGRVDEYGIVRETQIGTTKDVLKSLETTVEQAGTYYIYGKDKVSGTAGGINIISVAVTYDGVVIPEMVTVNATVTDSNNLLNTGDKVFFTATGETDVEATTGARLKKDTTYTLAVKNGTTTVSGVKATIDGETTYKADTDNDSVEIVIESTGGSVVTPPDEDAPKQPTATPSSGSLVSGTTVELKTDDADAQIYYIKSNTEISGTPDASSTLYSGAFTITEETYIKAVAIKDGKTSTVLELHYTIRSANESATPTANPEPGEVEKGTEVKLEAASGAKIYYTTDGNDPKAEESFEYTENTKIIIDADMTIKAIAVEEGKEPSQVMPFKYTVKTQTPPVDPTPEVKILKWEDCTITVPDILQNKKTTNSTTYVTYGTTKFAEGVDYSVEWKGKKENTDDTYEVTLTGLGRGADGRSVDKYAIEEKSVTVAYRVIPAPAKGSAVTVVDISKAKINLDETSKTAFYNAYPHEPKADFSKDKTGLEAKIGGRLRYTYKNNINAGKATVTISVGPAMTDDEKADTTLYVGSKTLTFNIKKAVLNVKDEKSTAKVDCTVVKENNYTGASTITVNAFKKVDDKITLTPLTQNVDYTVTSKVNAKKSEVAITVKGIGNNLSGSWKGTYEIEPLDVTKLTINPEDQTVIYSPKGGKLTQLTGTITENGKTTTYTLTEGVDYTAKYTYSDKKYKKASTQEEPSTVDVVITGKNGCTGKGKEIKGIEIKKADFNSCIVVPADIVIDSSVANDDVKFQKALEKAVVVTDVSGVKFKLNKEYTLGTPDKANKKVTIAPTDTTNYENKERTVTYRVAKNLAKEKDFAFKDNKATLDYDGRNPVEITQKVIDKYIHGLDATTITDAQRTYILDGANKNIEIVPGTYKNNTKKGTAQVTVKGIAGVDGGFYGTKVLKFKIVEK